MPVGLEEKTRERVDDGWPGAIRRKPDAELRAQCLYCEWHTFIQSTEIEVRNGPLPEHPAAAAFEGEDCHRFQEWDALVRTLIDFGTSKSNQDLLLLAQVAPE